MACHPPCPMWTSWSIMFVLPGSVQLNLPRRNNKAIYGCYVSTSLNIQYIGVKYHTHVSNIELWIMNIPKPQDKYHPTQLPIDDDFSIFFGNFQNIYFEIPSSARVLLGPPPALHCRWCTWLPTCPAGVRRPHCWPLRWGPRWGWWQHWPTTCDSVVRGSG